MNLDDWDIKVVNVMNDKDVGENAVGNIDIHFPEIDELKSQGPRCTIVTCYYQSDAKHSLESYRQWMTNFLTTVDNEMIIFCDQESFAYISEVRKPFEEKTHIYVFPMEEMYCAYPHYVEYWKKDLQRDVERHIHNINLYMIWNEKSMFVHRAMTVNPFETDFFMWCDIGCFRSPEELSLFQKEWPSETFLQSARKDKMYFLNITPFEEGDAQVFPNGLTRSFEEVTRIGATMFLGHKDVFETWIETFYKYMNIYMVNDYFAGKDQNIIASIYVLHPELFRLVHPVEGQGNPWFYLQRFFLEKDPESI